MKKILLAGVVTTSLILSSVPVVLADEVKSIQSSGQIQVLEDSKNMGMNLGKEFREAVEKALVKDIDVKVVESLKAKGYSYYKIAYISALSQKSGKSTDIVVNALKEPAKLAQTLGLKNEDIKAVEKSLKEKRLQIQKEYIEKAKKEHARLIEEIKKHKQELKSGVQNKTEVKEEIKKDVKQLNKIEQFKKEIKKEKSTNYKKLKKEVSSIKKDIKKDEKKLNIISKKLEVKKK